MGMYNTYAGVQLKVSEQLNLTEYDLGDTVDIEDGIYAGHGGFIVVIGKILVGRFDKITTTWLDKVSPDDLLNKYHPLKEVIERVVNNNKNRQKE